MTFNRCVRDDIIVQRQNDHFLGNPAKEEYCDFFYVFLIIWTFWTLKLLGENLAPPGKTFYSQNKISYIITLSNIKITI